MSRYSFAGPNIEDAVLHHDDDSYDAAIASGHKDTYAPEAWEDEATEGDETPKRGRGRPPKAKE
jgi:hypothetical protein